MSAPSNIEKADAGPAPLFGLLAEYDTPTDLVKASRKIRDAGYERWDTYTPFPVHGIDQAMGIKMTRLPWLVLGAAATGLITAFALQSWTNAIDYPFLISGKPYLSIPANVPIYFELTVLFSAFAALFGMLALNNLPMPAHPLDLKKRFRRVTDDKFFLVVEARDPKFDADETKALLAETTPVVLEGVPEDRITSGKLPAGLIYGLIVLAVAAVVPFALVAKARATKNTEPRVHAVGDMDWQLKFQAQQENPIFADKRAERPEEPGTVALGELRDDDHLELGKVGGAWARTFPPNIEANSENMKRGRDQFDVYCAPCHGLGGKGNGPINQRAAELAQGTWIPPTNFHQDYLRKMPVGQLFDTASNGIRNMEGYKGQISTDDRWRVIMYLRALQRSENATLDDVPEDQRSQLK